MNPTAARTTRLTAAARLCLPFASSAPLRENPWPSIANAATTLFVFFDNERVPREIHFPIPKNAKQSQFSSQVNENTRKQNWLCVPRPARASEIEILWPCLQVNTPAYRLAQHNSAVIMKSKMAPLSCEPNQNSTNSTEFITFRNRRSGRPGDQPAPLAAVPETTAPPG